MFKALHNLDLTSFYDSSPTTSVSQLNELLFTLLSRSQLLAVALCTPDLQQTLATLAYLLSRELHRDCGSSRSQFSPWRTLTPHSKSNSVSTLLEAACPEMSPS